jgi:hypothetical protein
LLRVQRQLLDRRYSNRRLFADERGLNYKAVYDIERAATGGRTDFTLDSVLTLAEGYNVSYQSVGAALEGGELEPLDVPSSPAVLSVVPPGADDEEEIGAVLEGRGERYPEFSAPVAGAIMALVPGIRAAVEKAARAEAKRRRVPVLTVLREVPPGALVFPDDAEYAGLWDEWRQTGSPGLRFTVGQMIRGAAQRRLQDEVLAEQAGGTSSG